MEWQGFKLKSDIQPKSIYFCVFSSKTVIFFEYKKNCVQSSSEMHSSWIVLLDLNLVYKSSNMSAPPPPRKGAYAKHVQNLHKDQFNSAHIKNGQELDLLEDIR